MDVVWIVLAVVLAALVVGLVVFIPARGRARRATREAPPLTPPPKPTAPPARGKSAPSVAAPPAAPSAGREAAEASSPVAAPSPGEAVAPEAESEGAAPDVAAAEAPPQLRTRLKTRGLLSGYVRALRSRGSVTDDDWDDLEVLLLRADVGVATTSELLDDLRARVQSGDLRGADAVADALRDELLRSLDPPTPVSGGPAANGERADDAGGAAGNGAGSMPVWLFVGVNGVGKTTTIGKMARRHQAEGRSVLLAAGDTFRAAAAEQLTQWAERTGAEIVRGAEGGDPSAVVFDAVQRASARGHDVVLADTAGRLHTKVNLVEELKKIRRVADRPPGHVTEVFLVLDATTGQNGLTQAREFLGAVGVTGVVLTKLDGSAKGGIVIAIQRELGLPVRYVGLGEGPDDLVPFDPEEFVDALFD
jgi:fused signal recognition particle receptor